MSDRELFYKYADICDRRLSRLMDVQESALFMALRDMLRRGAEQASELDRLNLYLDRQRAASPTTAEPQDGGRHE